ncbi:helix-turn-helix transcriptional regulator [Vibrio sp. FJH11]
MSLISYPLFEHCYQSVTKSNRTIALTQLHSQALSTMVAEHYVPENLWRRLVAEVNKLVKAPVSLPTFEWLLSIIPELACVANSPNGQIAIERYIKYQNLIGTSDSYLLTPTTTGIFIEYVPDKFDGHGILSAISNFSIISHLIKDLYDIQNPPITWYFPSDRISKPLNKLIKDDIRLSQTTCNLFIPSDYLTAPALHFNASIDSALISLAESQLDYVDSYLSTHLIVQKVKVHILRLYQNEQLEHCLERICESLHLSRWTLNRQLKKEGTSYQYLLTQFRNKKSRELLMQPNIPLSEIAFRLGFQSQSSFNRYIKSTFNCTPKDLRDTFLQRD